jgi:hypothetical protein
MYWNGRRAEAIAHTCALGLAIAARGPPWLLGSSCNASSVYSAPQAFPGWCRGRSGARWEAPLHFHDEKENLSWALRARGAAAASRKKVQPHVAAA